MISIISLRTLHVSSSQPYDFARSKGWKFAFTQYYYCSFIRSENSAKNELQSFSLGVMKFKGPTGRLFCNDLLHDEKLPLKCKKFPVSCHHFLPIHQLTKSFITCFVFYSELKSSTAIKSSEDYYAFKCNMNREEDSFWK